MSSRRHMNNIDNIFDNVGNSVNFFEKIAKDAITYYEELLTIKAVSLKALILYAEKKVNYVAFKKINGEIQ
jgi:hypothetical protein